jgi:hypothetical protein
MTCEGKSVNMSKLDIERKICEIRTWKEHLFLDISYANIDTLVPLLYHGSLLTVVSATCTPPFRPLRYQQNVCHQGGVLAGKPNGSH